MARQYINNTISAFYDLMNVDKVNVPLHISVLVDNWNTYLTDLQKATSKPDVEWETDKKLFIKTAIVDSFTPLRRYDYLLELGDPQKDEATGFEYYVLTLTSENKPVDFTADDVGTTRFSRVFEKLTGISTDGIPNKKAWAIYQKIQALSQAVGKEPAVQKNTTNAVLMFADEYSDWIFKVSNDTPDKIASNYKTYLTDKKK